MFTETGIPNSLNKIETCTKLAKIWGNTNRKLIYQSDRRTYCWEIFKMTISRSDNSCNDRQ